ncbi:MAG: NapC/NirT family cytochrome c [Desulfovibrio sp.]|jgi:nitrate/TMAO reductase-like tetraheme cytochrome c subunit|nr:NapC/NirT family cytochrome c [Desulfovibrio sp.]
MPEKKHTYRRAVIPAVALALFCGVSYALLSATSTMSFCSSACHEMEAQAAELRFSSHARDKEGGDISCVRCHIPAGFGPRYMAVKTYSGLKDLYVHLFRSGAPLLRADLQKTARRFIDDGNCLLCHDDLYRDARGEQTVTDLGRIAHDAYLGKNGQASSRCVGCHINIAHLPEFDRRLEVNGLFAERIKNKEAERDAD